MVHLMVNMDFIKPQVILFILLLHQLEDLLFSTTIDGNSDTDWHLFTAHIDISGLKVYVYVDGDLKNPGGTAFTGTFPAMADAYEFVIGAANNSGGTGFDEYADTQIRDVRVYHKDVTSAANLALLQDGKRLR